MNFSQNQVKDRAMVTYNVAPMPPTEKSRNRRHASITFSSVANSFLCAYRGDVMRHLLAPYLVLIMFLSLSVFANAACAQDTNSAQSEQEKWQEFKNREPSNVGSSHVKDKTPDEIWYEFNHGKRENLAGTPKDHKSVWEELKRRRLDQENNMTAAESEAKTASDEPFTGQVQTDRITEAESGTDDSAPQSDDEDVQRIRNMSKKLPPFLQNALAESRKGGARTPLLVFRHWAHQRKPFFGSFLFCLFVGLVGTAFFPKQIAVAQGCCRSQFWKCIGKALLAGITLLITVRIFHLLVITAPLAAVLIGLLEFVIVAGLAVGISLIGERILGKRLSAHPRWASFTKILIGSLIIALIVQIPGVGLLPRIGIRIAMLIAILGAGGLLRTKFGTQPLSEG